MTSSRLLDLFSITKLPTSSEFKTSLSAVLSAINPAEKALKEVSDYLVILLRDELTEDPLFKDLKKAILLHQAHVTELLGNLDTIKASIKELKYSADATLLKKTLEEQIKISQKQQDAYLTLIKEGIAIRNQVTYLQEKIEAKQARWVAGGKHPVEEGDEIELLTKSAAIFFRTLDTTISKLHKDAFHPLTIEMDEKEKLHNEEIKKLNALIATISQSLDGIATHLKEKKMASNFIIDLKNTYVELILAGTLNQTDLAQVMEQIRMMIAEVQERIPSAKSYCQKALANFIKLEETISGWRPSTTRRIAGNVLGVAADFTAATLQVALPLPGDATSVVTTQVYEAVLGGADATGLLMSALHPKTTVLTNQLADKITRIVAPSSVEGQFETTFLTNSIDKAQEGLQVGLEKLADELQDYRTSPEEGERKMRVIGLGDIEIKEGQLDYVAPLPDTQFSSQLIRDTIIQKYRELLRKFKKPLSPEENFRIFMNAVGIVLTLVGVATPLSVIMLAIGVATVELGFKITGKYKKHVFEETFRQQTLRKLENINRGFALLQMGNETRIVTYPDMTIAYMKSQLAILNEKLQAGLRSFKSSGIRVARAKKEHKEAIKNARVLQDLINRLEAVKGTIFSIDLSKHESVVTTSGDLINAFGEIKTTETMLSAMHLGTPSPLDVAYTEAVTSLWRLNALIGEQVDAHKGVTYHTFYRKMNGPNLGTQLLEIKQEVATLEKMLPVECHLPHEVEESSKIRITTSEESSRRFSR